MKSFKAVKVGLILLTLLVSIITVFSPGPIAAQGLFNGNIDVTYDTDDVQDTIRPETDINRIDFYISHFVEK